jgi:hypothetical protein
MMTRDRIFIIAIAAQSILLILTAPLYGQVRPSKVMVSQRIASAALEEYQVKAGYVCNFARFVEWPEEAFAGPNDQFIIAVLGSEPLTQYLDDMVRNLTVNERNIIIKHFVTVDDLDRCHILFVSESKRKFFSDILSIIKGKPVLTVSDMKEFTSRGGIINFVKVKNDISFEINAAAAEKARLKFSSKLLKLANGMGGAR